VQLLAGKQACSAATGGYCRARERIPESLLQLFLQKFGAGIQDRMKNKWHWKNRQVFLADGTKVSMPDTKANQKIYPQEGSQKPGLGFPIARVVGLFSLSSGAIIDVAIGPCRGKGTGEPTMLRSISHHLKAGDVLLFDRLFTGYFDLAFYLSKKIDVVSRQYQGRKKAIKTIRRLSKNDSIVQIQRPFKAHFRWAAKKLYKIFPESIVLREIKVRIKKRGFRVSHIVLITSLLDPKKFPADDVADLFKRRWQVETDFRSLKTYLKMDVLRSKTPEMVRKEILVHAIGYNIISLFILEAGLHSKREPRALSFTGALQAINQIFLSLLHIGKNRIKSILHQIFKCICISKVKNRPDRFEPRKVKRRPKPCSLLAVPRKQWKKDFLKSSKESA
jgi:hypothetical protein